MVGRRLDLDVAKAICIILVVVGHFFPDYAPLWYGEIRNVIYSFHMPLFLFVSGYVYMLTFNQDQAYFDFLKKKFKRLLIPYLTTSFLVISFKLLSQSFLYVENPVDILSYVRLFYQPEAGYYLWFVQALWIMFVLTPLFKTKRDRKVLLLISIILYILSRFELGYNNIFSVKEFTGFYLYFVIGVIFVDSDLHYIYRNKIYGNIAILLFASLYLLNRSFPNVDLNFSVAVTGIISILYISFLISVRHFKGWIRNVSDNQYIIYLFHTTFEGLSKAVLNIISVGIGTGMIINGSYFFLVALAVIISGVAGPILLNEFVIKKYKLLRFLFSIKQ